LAFVPVQPQATQAGGEAHGSFQKERPMNCAEKLVYRALSALLGGSGRKMEILVNRKVGQRTMKRIGGIIKVLAGVAILFTCSGINARADSALSGLTVSANWNYPQLGTVYEHSNPSSAVVGPSDAFFVFGPFNRAMDITVSASTSTITLDGENNGGDGGCCPYDTKPFNGFVISVGNPPPGFAFTSVQIQSVNWAGQSPQISFDATDIYVNMEGMKQIGPGSQIVLNYIFAKIVPIIIKPGDTQPATINAKSNGKTPVAILSDTNWSAPANVDQSSLTFGETGNEQSLAHCDGSVDVNGDAILDLVCTFYTQETGFKDTDTTGTLKGKTLGGISLQGTGPVTIIH
jgi:hypothetical protein